MKNARFLEVLGQKKAGYDCLKIYSGAFHKIIGTAERLRLPAVGHAQRFLGLEETMKLKSIEHIEEMLLFFKDGPLTDPANEAIARKLAERRVYVTPTLIGLAFHKYISQPELNELLNRPETAFVSEPWYDRVTKQGEETFKHIRRRGYAHFKKQYECPREVAAFLHKSKVRILLGTDTALLDAPGFAVHGELQTLVEVGLSRPRLSEPEHQMWLISSDPHTEVGESKYRMSSSVGRTRHSQQERAPC